jgi:DNA-binding MarR family transcriptional regulator
VTFLPEKMIGRELRSLSNLIMRQVERQQKDMDTVTAANGWIIGYIADNSPRDIYQRDLEETFGITRSTVSKNINLMVQKGLIVREGVAHDARLKKLVLTPKAWEMFEKMKRDSFEMEKRLTSGFSPEELKLLLQLIERMKQNMR